MEMKKTQFDQQPALVVTEGASVRINFDAESKEVTVSNASGEDEEAPAKTVWEAYVVRVPQPLTRDSIINAIVSAAYPQDVMQAVINNHALDEEDDESYEAHLAEWKAMQLWRRHAKDVAQEVQNQ